ncbi:MAG: glycosyltransferase [Bacteroidia bacterium]|nr:glycosyltransferase [Bacteroidia bacterium]
MKIQYLTQYYQPFLDKFYARFPDFNSLSYQQMLQLLLNQYFADTGAAYHYTFKHGHEAFIIIANCEALQKKWAFENNVKYSESNWEKEIALAQIKHFKPTVFYIESIFGFFGTFLNEAKLYCNKVVAWISTPFSPSLPLHNIDVIFSSTQQFVKSFNEYGIKAYYLLPAFDSRVLDEIKNPQPKSIPLSFVGGWSDVHENRKQFLKYFAKQAPVKIWGYGYQQFYSRRTWAYYKHRFFPDNPEIEKAFVEEVWGLNMYDVLQKSLITLNIHEALLKGDVGNMRMFEASGVGTMLLNDYGNNLAQLFEIDKEIVSYKSFPEALEKYNYYCTHPEKAIEIGLNAQKRTLRDYNYDVYMENLLSYLKQHI